MKRFFFSLIALSAAAIGCTQSAMLETPDLFGTEVSFSPYTGRTPVTKATSIEDKEGLANGGNDGFNVYCFFNEDTTNPYLENVKVTSTDKGESWTPAQTVYWPDATTSSSTLSFVAYSANAVNHGLSGVNTSGFTFTVPTNVDQQVDLLATAYYKGHTLKNTSSGNVTLKFQHLLSRVGFKVLTTTNKSVVINALSFGGTLATVGTLDFDTQVINAGTTESAVPALSVSTTKAANEYYQFLVDDSNATTKDDVTISNANEKAVPVTRTNNSNYLMIMPQAVSAQGDVTINVTYTIGSSKSKSAQVELPAGFVFTAGKAYEFILNISTSSIKFTVTEDEWDNPTEDDNSYPLIPTDPNKVSANVKVTGSTAVEVILTPNEDNLGTIGFKYTVAPASGAVNWEDVDPAFSFTNYTKGVSLTKQEIDELNPNTTYVYCTYSEKSNETTHYSEGSFVTKAAIQVALEIDGGVTNIYTNSVDVYCTYPSDLSLPESKFGFCWVQGEGLPIVGNSNIVIGTPEKTGAFKATITGLEALTEYTCRAYIELNGVISYSDPISFMTAPIIETQPDSGDNGNTGTGGGSGENPPPGPPVDEWDEPTDPDQEIEF